MRLSPNGSTCDTANYYCDFYLAVRSSADLRIRPVTPNYTSPPVTAPAADVIVFGHTCTRNAIALSGCLREASGRGMAPSVRALPILVVLNKMFEGALGKLAIIRQNARRVAMTIAATPLAEEYGARSGVRCLFVPYGTSERFGRFAPDARAGGHARLAGRAAGRAGGGSTSGHGRLSSDQGAERGGSSSAPALRLEELIGSALEKQIGKGRHPVWLTVNRSALDDGHDDYMSRGYLADFGFSGGPQLRATRYAFRLQILHSQRMKRLQRAGLKIYLAGGGYMPETAYIARIASTKVWLATTELGLHASTRFYEVLVSGRAMLLCDRNPPALDPIGIVEGVHAAMFNTTEEFEQKLLYYARHEEERRALVRAARSLALERHMWHMRGSLVARALRETLPQWEQRARAASPSEHRTGTPQP